VRARDAVVSARVRSELPKRARNDNGYEKHGGMRIVHSAGRCGQKAGREARRVRATRVTRRRETKRRKIEAPSRARALGFARLNADTGLPVPWRTDYCYVVNNTSCRPWGSEA
jgi:hypothetical protein